MAKAPKPETKPQEVYHAYPKTCQTFGVISLMVTLIGFLACTGIGMDKNINLNIERTDDFQALLDKVDTLRIWNVILYIALTIIPICFFFSCVLLVGVQAKSASMLKSYKNFGIAVSILSAVPSIAWIKVNYGNGPWFAYLTVFFIFLVYLPVLGVICSTYKAYLAPEPNADSSATTEQQDTTLTV